MTNCDLLVQDVNAHNCGWLAHNRNCRDGWWQVAVVVLLLMLSVLLSRMGERGRMGNMTHTHAHTGGNVNTSITSSMRPTCDTDGNNMRRP